MNKDWITSGEVLGEDCVMSGGGLGVGTEIG